MRPNAPGSSMETAPELPDDLPQFFRVLLDDPPWSSTREGLGFEVCSPAGGSSDWLMVERSKTRRKDR
jgi:hypothetical protein